MKSNKSSTFRHILAGLVLVISFLVLSIIVNLIFSSVLYIRSWLVATHHIAEIIRSLIVWVTIGVFFLPFSLLKELVISLCERVSPTRRGARYIVFATLNGLYYALALYSCIVQKAWYDLLILVYMVILLISLTKDGLALGTQNSAASFSKPGTKSSPPAIVDTDTGLVIETSDDVQIAKAVDKQKSIDAVYEELFRDQLNPFTNKPITSQADYEEYLSQVEASKN